MSQEQESTDGIVLKDFLAGVEVPKYRKTNQLMVDVAWVDSMAEEISDGWDE